QKHQRGLWPEDLRPRDGAAIRRPDREARNPGALVNKLVVPAIAVRDMNLREVVLQLRRLAQINYARSVRRKARRAVDVVNDRARRTTKHRNLVEIADVEALLCAPHEVEIIAIGREGQANIGVRK